MNTHSILYHIVSSFLSFCTYLFSFFLITSSCVEICSYGGIPVWLGIQRPNIKFRRPNQDWLESKFPSQKKEVSNYLLLKSLRYYLTLHYSTTYLYMKKCVTVNVLLFVYFAFVEKKLKKKAWISFCRRLLIIST